MPTPDPGPARPGGDGGVSGPRRGSATPPAAVSGPARQAARPGGSGEAASSADGTPTGDGTGPATPPDGGADTGDLTGPALARAVLDAALARRRANAPRRRTPGGVEPRDPAAGAGGATTADRDPASGAPRRRLRGYSGPGPDPRDPQLFGTVLARLVKARGWQQQAAEATVFGAWERVVGPDVADHCRPVKLENGELTVEAESTAWATQLRLLAGSLLQRIAAEVGHNVVRRLHVHGPTAPSWSRGPRRVRGRGPRDTYG